MIGLITGAKDLVSLVRREFAARAWSPSTAPLTGLAPVAPDLHAPTVPSALPDFWDYRRLTDGKPDKSRCAAELRMALAIHHDRLADRLMALLDANTKLTGFREADARFQQYVGEALAKANPPTGPLGVLVNGCIEDELDALVAERDRLRAAVADVAGCVDRLNRGDEDDGNAAVNTCHQIARIVAKAQHPLLTLGEVPRG